jgi:GNAT superfamily N-acetyltransferase
MRRLVEALNICCLPHAASPGRAGAAAMGGEPGVAAITLADFKRDIRERQVWCSSCMIAFEGSDPIGVLIGAKRATETLIDRIAVRPDRMRLGHGRHMLDSLGAKLAILGPPGMVAEIPAALPGASAFFAACGFTPAGALTDWILEDGAALAAAETGTGAPGPAATGVTTAAGGAFAVPVSVADLAANRLLADPPGVAWDRSIATLATRAGTIEGIAFATVDRIEAFALYRPAAGGRGACLDALGPPVGAGGAAGIDPPHTLTRLLRLVLERTGTPVRLPRLSEAELPACWLEHWGFRAGARHRRHTATARAG